MNRFTSCTLFLVFCLNSCDQKSSPRFLTVSDITSFPGHQYYFSINSTTTVSTRYGGKQSKNVNKTLVGLQYLINKDSAGNGIIELTYEEINLETENDNGKQNVQVKFGVTSDDPVEKILGGILGSPLRIHIDKKGKLQSIDGTAALLEKVDAQLTTFDEKSKNAIHDQIDQLIGEEHVWQNVRQHLKFLPDTSIKIGDEWQEKATKNEDIPLITRTVHTLNNIKGNLAYISAKSQLQSINEIVRKSVLGTNVTTDLSGTEKALFQLNTQTGVVLKGEIESTISGNIEVMGQKVPIEISIQRNVLSEKGKH